MAQNCQRFVPLLANLIGVTSVEILEKLCGFSIGSSLICGSRHKDFVILACTVLIQSQSVMDRHTDGQTDALTIAKTREALHAVTHKRSCAVLNFARFVSLVCIVARSRKKSGSLSLVLFLARYRQVRRPSVCL